MWSLGGDAMPGNKSSPKRCGKHRSGLQVLQRSSEHTGLAPECSQLLKPPLPGTTENYLLQGGVSEVEKSNSPKGELSRVRDISCQHILPPALSPETVYGLGLDNGRIHLTNGVWHVRERTFHPFNGRILEVAGLDTTGFRKLRDGTIKSWLDEKTYRTFPRWMHDETGLVIEGNNKPRFFSISISRMLHGLNVFNVSQDELSSVHDRLTSTLLPLLSQVIAEPEIGGWQSLEIFANLPVKDAGIIEKLQGLENSCFRKIQEHHEDYGLYRYGSGKTLVPYLKHVELWKCQGVSLLALRDSGCGNILRFELRLKGVGMVRKVMRDGVIDLKLCYALIRRHVLGYRLPELSIYFPESYHEFQNQNWRHNHVL